MGCADLSIRECADHTVVSVRGDLDAVDAARFANLLHGLLARSPDIVLDLTALEFIDCAALGALRRVRAMARGAAGDLVLFAPHEQVMRVLALTEVLDPFVIRPGLAACDPVPAGEGRPGRPPGESQGDSAWLA